MEIKLSAIDLKYVDNVPTYKEDKIRSKAYIAYGSDNKWPDYLYSLYRDVSTLNTLINGSADYTAGNGVQEDYIVNTSGVLLSELIRQIAFDRWLYGGFAIQVIKDQLGRLRELYYIPFNRIRSDENNTEFWYSKDWTTWSPKTIKYPAFDSEKDDPTSIFYFKGNTDQVYPICPFNGSITCCEVEKRINKFHLNEISNNFSGNVVINFNNGVPNEEQQAEIERLVNAKFSGENNAGRVLISYNDSKDQEVTISKIAEDNLDERYKDLAERSRDQIFIAFRATPSLFGLSTSTGFNAEEYQNQFKIYLRTVIKPIQNEIIRAIYKITGKEVIINQFNLFSMIDNYFKLIDNLKNEALKEPNCRTVLYPDIYEMNSTPDLKYWVFAITPGIIQAEDDYLTVNLNLYYVDRLDDSKNNYLEIQSAGIQALRNILFRFVNKYPEVDLGSEQFNIFYQKFIDECSGVYVNVSFTIPTSNCLIGEDYE